MAAGEGPRFVLRRMREEDLPRLAEMKREVFGPRRATEAILRHQYVDTVCPPLPGAVAELEGQVVGFVGRYPVPVQLGDDVVINWHGGDAMVLPVARGHSLYVDIVDKNMEFVEERGGGLIIGYPNEYSAPRLLAPPTLWRSGFIVPTFALIVRPSVLAPGWAPRAVARRTAFSLVAAVSGLLSRKPGGWEIATVPTAPQDTDGLWERHKVCAPNQTVRNLAYLRWRYEQNPAVEYRFIEARRAGVLGGLMVVAEEGFGGAEALMVCDWLLHEPDSSAFDALLAEAVHQARAGRVAAALLNTLPPFGRRALKHGFIRVPDRLLPRRMHLCLRAPVPEGHTMEEVLDPRRWFMTLGDWDVV